MGYREDVAVAYTQEGWRQLLSCINELESEDVSNAIDLIDNADKHIADNDGNHFLFFSCVKVYADDMKPYMYAHESGEIHSDTFFMLCLGEDGAESMHGNWWDNHFGIVSHREIQYELNGVDVKGPALPYKGDKKPFNPIITVTVADDHTCTSCGNTRCSKTEKSCWKCGTAI
jgi:hypothetical protein